LTPEEHGHDHDHDHPHGQGSQLGDLTRNQALVLGALSNAAQPLSAYTILDHVRPEGVRAPLQVYRALEKLIELGFVHRIESLNAFMACRQPGCSTHSSLAFTICDKCGTVGEVADHHLDQELSLMTSRAGLVPTRSTIELRGICEPCRKA
jgi:Fur family transcriptional regulator, zinc uptake regulator